MHPWHATKGFTVAFNMMFCAAFFFWARTYPRETISGLFGRKALKHRDHWFWSTGARWIDAMHPHETAHCMETAVLEAHMRGVLYQ